MKDPLNCWLGPSFTSFYLVAHSALCHNRFLIVFKHKYVLSTRIRPEYGPSSGTVKFIESSICLSVGVMCDSTNENTGWINGALVNLEKLLGRNLLWLVCDLHTLEKTMK